MEPLLLHNIKNSHSLTNNRCYRDVLTTQNLIYTFIWFELHLCRLCAMICIRKKISTFKKNRIIKEIVDNSCSGTTATLKAYSFPTDNKWCANTTKALAWHNSKTKCPLKTKYCTDAYFYDRLSLKINQNIGRTF